MNYWTKLTGDAWGVSCDTERQPGEQVTVTTKAGKTSLVTLGERQNRLGYVYAVARQNPEARSVGDLSGILALFDKAAQHLKRPAIVLAVPEVGPAGALNRGMWTIRLSIAGGRAKVPGSVTVLDGERGDEGRDWLGRITVDGTYQPGRAANGRTEAITARLRAFAATPALVAKDSARLTGRCCFCNLALTDERSTAVGYGATCADHYGLPWGAR
jgi:hypothetical protein